MTRETAEQKDRMGAVPHPPESLERIDALRTILLDRARKVGYGQQRIDHGGTGRGSPETAAHSLRSSSR